MRKLTYKKCFTYGEKPFFHKLSRKSFSLYKRFRLWDTNKRPLQDYEKGILDDSDNLEHPSIKMPMGYDAVKEQNIPGTIELQYIDFFDFLPKEDIGSFKKSLHHFAIKNDVPLFSHFITKEDYERIDIMSKYYDASMSVKMHRVAISKDEYLRKNAPHISVSLHNLSTSFLVIKYRAYISDSYNAELSEILNKEYSAANDIARQFNTPWYKPWKFGKEMIPGDRVRYAAMYDKLSELKWAIIKGIQHYFKIYFAADQMFPPTFLTYKTNFQDFSERNIDSYLRSLGLATTPDYSQAFNLCVGWNCLLGEAEGESASAFCGGRTSPDNHLPEIAMNGVSDIYGLYLVARTIQNVATRDIAMSNKKISKALRCWSTLRLLRVRASVKRKLYYSYRFISEFSGNTIDMSNLDSFNNPNMKSGSFTKSVIPGIVSQTSDTKQHIDQLLRLLDDSANYQATRSNLILQWVIMIVAILSFIIAGIALYRSGNPSEEETPPAYVDELSPT